MFVGVFVLFQQQTCTTILAFHGTVCHQAASVRTAEWLEETPPGGYAVCSEPHSTEPG